jgi:hypothetical protein
LTTTDIRESRRPGHKPKPARPEEGLSGLSGILDQGMVAAGLVTLAAAGTIARLAFGARG